MVVSVRLCQLSTSRLRAAIGARLLPLPKFGGGEILALVG